MGKIRRTALAVVAVAMISGVALATEVKPAEPAKTTSTTDRLKAKKKAPASSLDRQATAASSPKPAAKHAPKAAVKSGT